MSRGTLVQAPFKALGTSRGAPRCWELSKIVRVRPFGQCQSAGILVSTLEFQKQLIRTVPSDFRNRSSLRNAARIVLKWPEANLRGPRGALCLLLACNHRASLGAVGCCRGSVVVVMWVIRGLGGNSSA